MYNYSLIRLSSYQPATCDIKRGFFFPNFFVLYKGLEYSLPCIEKENIFHFYILETKRVFAVFCHNNVEFIVRANEWALANSEPSRRY